MIATLEAQLASNADPTSDNHHIAALEEQVFKYPHTLPHPLIHAHSHFLFQFKAPHL